MSGPSRTWKKITDNKFTILALIVIVGIITGGVYWYIGLSPQTEPTPTAKAKSTFTFISYVDGEVVSPFVEADIWVPKSGAIFDEEEDVYTMTNYEREETGADGDDISIDLSIYDEPCWLEITGNSLFANTYIKLLPGVNKDYIQPVYDLSSDVNFNMFTRDTLAIVTLGAFATDGNYTIIMDVDHMVDTNCHYGDDWSISTEDFNDMTLAEKMVIWDEAEWQCQAPLYDPTIDEEKDYNKKLELLTDAFTLKMTFNDTVSVVDGSGTQINMTINDSNEPIEVVTSGEYIYLIFYEVIDFVGGSYDFDFGITFGENITLSDIDSGRIVVPRDDDNLGAFTKYSDIGA